MTFSQLPAPQETKEVTMAFELKLKSSHVPFTLKSLTYYLKDPSPPSFKELKENRSDVAMLMLLSNILYSETAEKHKTTFNCYISSIENFSFFLSQLSHSQVTPSHNVNIPCIFHFDSHHVAANIRFIDNKFRVYIFDSSDISLRNTIIMGLIDSLLNTTKCEPDKIEIYFLFSGIQKDPKNCPFFSLKTALTLSKTENLDTYIEKTEKKLSADYQTCPTFIINRKYTPAVLQRMNQMEPEKFKKYYSTLLLDKDKIGKHKRTLSEHFQLFSRPQPTVDEKESYIGHTKQKYLQKIKKFLQKKPEEISQLVIKNHTDIFYQRLQAQLNPQAQLKPYFKYKM